MGSVKKALLAVFFFSGFVLVGFALDPDGSTTITFRNDTAANIEYLFIMHGDSDHWGPDILGMSDVLNAGDSRVRTILHPDKLYVIHILAVDSVGNVLVLMDHQITTGMESVAGFTNGSMWKDKVKFKYTTITFSNDVLPIHNLFISPDDSRMWGVDLLSNDFVLEPEEAVSFVFLDEREAAVSYSLLAFDEDDDTYHFSFDIDEDNDGDTFAITFDDLIF